MCGSRNSCGGCNECVNNPDCDVTSLSCSKGCASYNSCGKCIECRADPCDSRVEVTVPPYATCSSYYSDCPTKCSGFSCYSGYTLVGNLCVNGSADSCPGGAPGSTCMCGGTHTGIAFSNSHLCR